MSGILTGAASEGTTNQEDAAAEGVGDTETRTVTAGSAGAEEGPHVSVMSGRPIFCLVCNMATMGPEGSVFIQPCRCGYWVHDQCLINVTLQFEDYNPDSRAIGCKICRRAYNISPVKGFLLRYAVKLSNTWYQVFCYMCMEMFLELVADVNFIQIGSLVFNKVYGPEEAASLISSMSPLRAIYTCQLIPVATIAITNIPWEQDFLGLLRKDLFYQVKLGIQRQLYFLTFTSEVPHFSLQLLLWCSSLPLVGGVFPKEYREVADIYKGSSSFSLNLVGGLLLPFYAVAASKLFACCVRDPYHQFLLGGATVVLIKGVCKMYYKHQKYVRYCTFTVVDLAPPEK